MKYILSVSYFIRLGNPGKCSLRDVILQRNNEFAKGKCLGVFLKWNEIRFIAFYPIQLLI